MTAQGSEEKIERAKEMISAAVVGLVIVLAAYAFTQFVFSQLASRPGTGTNPTAGTTAGKTGVICEIITTEQACKNPNNEPVCVWLQPSPSTNGGCFEQRIGQ